MLTTKADYYIARYVARNTGRPTPLRNTEGTIIAYMTRGGKLMPMSVHPRVNIARMLGSVRLVLSVKDKAHARHLLATTRSIVSTNPARPLP